MAINETARDIINFPGGTPKTITLDIAKIVTVGGSPEGDEVFVASATTAATASGGATIQSIFKDRMERGFCRSSGLLTSSLVDVPSNYAIKVAIDETSSSNGVDITLTSGNAKLLADVGQDIEEKLRAAGKLGGAKAGDLSYLNAQVRTVGNTIIIESGTVSDSFTGSNKSSVEVVAPTGLGLTDARSLLGFDIPTSSQTLAARQLAQTSLAGAYTSGDKVSVASTANFTAGDSMEIRNASTSQVVLVSGVGVAGGLGAAEIRFVTVSGQGTGLANTYAVGALVRKFHPLDDPNPRSAITQVDQLYRFAIDSIVNQIDFSA